MPLVPCVCIILLNVDDTVGCLIDGGQTCVGGGHSRRRSHRMTSSGCTFRWLLPHAPTWATKHYTHCNHPHTVILIHPTAHSGNSNTLQHTLPSFISRFHQRIRQSVSKQLTLLNYLRQLTICTSNLQTNLQLCKNQIHQHVQ